MTEAAEWFRQMVARHEGEPEYWVEYLKLVFSEEIGRIMDERGVSQAELARRLGTSRAYVAKVLRSTANLTLATMAKLALALDARVDLSLVPKEKHVSSFDSGVERPLRERTFRPARQTRHRAARPEFIASDKPAKSRGHKTP
ncbi:MAG: helix-turn-helix transcriptional regulator [candidate division WOR-3 bacterium]|nr:helix-turn-helix transcriptional regulator [candidate division WOR-3 bacterium]